MIKQKGTADNMKSGGPDHSYQTHQNKVFRDLHENGHDLNHSYKNPAASVGLDVKAAGTNHSYLHPQTGNTKTPGAQAKGNAVTPVNQTGRATS